MTKAERRLNESSYLTDFIALIHYLNPHNRIKAGIFYRSFCSRTVSWRFINQNILVRR
jgi:hypothetical protein